MALARATPRSTFASEAPLKSSLGTKMKSIRRETLPSELAQVFPESPRGGLRKVAGIQKSRSSHNLCRYSPGRSSLSA
eukprot:8769891-Pyramimonas_sp.AAC.1